MREKQSGERVGESARTISGIRVTPWGNPPGHGWTSRVRLNAVRLGERQSKKPVFLIVLTKGNNSVSPIIE